MSDLIICEKEKLIEIADAIRAKTGSSEPIGFPSEFAPAIEGIEGSGECVQKPFCVMAVACDADNIVNQMININAEMTVEGSKYIQTHALYDGERLPLLPQDILTQYPYAFIYKDTDEDFYRVVFSTGLWWWTDSGDRGMNPTVTESCPIYKATLSSDTWEFLENRTSKFINFAYWNIWYAHLYWANFNVPNGSAESTSYYKKATKPGLTI